MTPAKTELNRAPLQAEEPYPPITYAWYVVGVLTLIYVFSYIDRIILSLLVKQLKSGFQITDTQVSLLTGFAFVAFYTLCGIPFGRLADSRSRRAIIAVGCVLWSVMTALCGVARQFTQMVFCRIGVGVGEAALSPSAFSLITDYFPKKRLATAISVYSMGIYLGAGLAYLLGGLVIILVRAREFYPLPIVGEIPSWQVIFFIIGLPGIFAALLLYTVREPVRRGRAVVQAAQRSADSETTSARQVLRYIRDNRFTFICHNLGFGLIALSTNAGGVWNPTYFDRNLGWKPAQSGIVLGAILAIAGAAGIVSGGRLSDYLAERGFKDAPIRVGMLAAFFMIPFGTAFYLAPTGTIAAWLYVPLAFLASAPLGVAPAAIQQIMPNDMRGQASAVYLFVVNVVGLGLGPLATAMMTDRVFHDDNAIRYSLIIVGGVAEFAAAIVLWIGRRPFTASLDRLRREVASL